MKFLIYIFFVIAVAYAGPIGIHVDGNEISQSGGDATGIDIGSNVITQGRLPLILPDVSNLYMRRKTTGVSATGNKLLQKAFAEGVMIGIGIIENNINQRSSKVADVAKNIWLEEEHEKKALAGGLPIGEGIMKKTFGRTGKDDVSKEIEGGFEGVRITIDDLVNRIPLEDIEVDDDDEVVWDSGENGDDCDDEDDWDDEDDEDVPSHLNPLLLSNKNVKALSARKLLVVPDHVRATSFGGIGNKINRKVWGSSVGMGFKSDKVRQIQAALEKLKESLSE